MSMMPTGRPASSTTGSSLIRFRDKISMASASNAPGLIVTGWRTIDSAIGRSSCSSCRRSSSLARSLSVNRPDSARVVNQHDRARAASGS